MDALWTKELEQEFNLLTLELKKSENYQKYQSLRKQLNENQEIMENIEQIRIYQKELVKLEHSNKDVIPTLTKYQKSLEKLEQNPLYHAYKISEDELNNTLQYMKNQIEKTIDSIVL